MKQNRVKKLMEITRQHIKDFKGKIKRLERLNTRRRRELAAEESVKKRAVVMYDSIDLSQIPPNAPAVAGYVGGHWPTYARLVHNFPKAKHLSIAISSTEDADCLDIETGNATPQDAPGWIKRQKARGISRPCLYANLSTMSAVKAELSRAGILWSSVRLWVAHYTYVPHIPNGYDACQWTDHSMGRNLDESLLRGNFFDA